MSPELKHVEALARLGGNAAMRHYGAVTAEFKAANSPVTAADREANDRIVAGLKAAFPGEPILSEESADSHKRLDAKRVWIVDPLDGTKEFIAQNGEFSVMIGLAVDGTPVLGVVYLPALNVMYSAELGGGAYVERMGVKTRLQCLYADNGPLRMVASRSHADPILQEIQETLHIFDVMPSGSV
ncbi:MAG TPA: 3'(2'),5'-bisphosphate nucleotidase CysQ, partial [Longimicrobiales bacterium]